MNTADPASPQPDAARWIASNTPCLGCLHQYVSHHRDFGECALCGCVSFKNPEDQPEPAPPSAGGTEMDPRPTTFADWWLGWCGMQGGRPPYIKTAAEDAWNAAMSDAQRQHATEREGWRETARLIAEEREAWKRRALDREIAACEQHAAEVERLPFVERQWVAMTEDHNRWQDRAERAEAALEAARAEAARLLDLLKSARVLMGFLRSAAACQEPIGPAHDVQITAWHERVNAALAAQWEDA